MKKENYIELLAPAGNMECLYAAVSSGADAVYFAGKLFGARSFADNFSDEELKDAVSYCHLRGVKAYITVNTLVSDREIPEALSYLKMLCEIGVDAVIVQDIGLCSLITENFPQLPIHGSTQMTVHNAKGVLALEKMGVEQVVLSRELTINEIKKIKEETNAKLEVFAHGALCMCYSGQCLMSSVLGGRSGNRGKCAQPCRLEYRINENREKGFYLSLKDLCSLNHISELREIGVSSLKIEGRMKGAEYVSTVVGIYRRYIDSGEVPTKEDIEALDRIFYRGGLTDGYLTGKTGKEMFCFQKPDNPYDKQIKTAVNYGNYERKIKLSAKANIEAGKLPCLNITDGEISVSVYGDNALEISKNNPIREELVKEKISKTGGTPYEFCEIAVLISGNPHISVSGINELRRKALLEFEKKYLESFKRNAEYSIPIIYSKEKEKAEFTCRVLNISQFKIAKLFDFSLFYVPVNIIYKNIDEFLDYKDKIIIETDGIIKDYKGLKEKLKELKSLGFLNLSVNNLGLIDEEDFELFGGMRLNVFNSHSLNLLKDKGFESCCLSPELNLAAIRDLKKPVKTEVMVYGHLPLMISENCVIRNNNDCPCGNNVNYITDRKGIKFPVVRDGESCRSVILNSLPLFMGDKKEELIKSGAERLMLYFTVETERKVKEICDIFFFGGRMIDEYTRLHYNKGVL